jgi:hypothetical protein
VSTPYFLVIRLLSLDRHGTRGGFRLPERSSRRDIDKRIAIAGYDIIQVYHFKSPYTKTQRLVESNAATKTGGGGG